MEYLTNYVTICYFQYRLAMLISYSKPYYKYEEIQTCIDTRKVYPSKRVANYLDNHGYEVPSFVMEVLRCICRGEAVFDESVLLDKCPGVRADIYRVNYDNEYWYVKFYIDHGVIVWSCKPDGSNW